MPMPDERARALRFAGKNPGEMLIRADVPRDLKQQVRVTLRYYPTEEQPRWMAQDVARLPANAMPCWLAGETSIAHTRMLER
jgi:hypothetical protein